MYFVIAECKISAVGLAAEIIAVPPHHRDGTGRPRKLPNLLFVMADIAEVHQHVKRRLYPHRLAQIHKITVRIAYYQNLHVLRPSL